MIKAIRDRNFQKSIDILNVKLNKMKEIDIQIVKNVLKKNNFNKEDSIKIIETYRELRQIQYEKFLNKFKGILDKI